ncbi:MAG: fasciclin domain-containing protein [Prevotella sp.]|nr:fasciclin domain-containing protein [Prevotella sp.]
MAALFTIHCSLFISAMLASCADDWNDHYDATTTSSGTLWQAISSQQELSRFASVVKACGYDIVLDGSQTFSVFAPTNEALSQAEADSLIAEFQRQQAAGIRSDNNTVVRQFLQNHIALYKHPVSSLTNDSIAMMNSKYEVLTGQLIGNRQLRSSNALYNNGLLFTIDRKLDYFPNVFEYLGHDHELDSVYQFFNRYSVYQFNDAKSVPGEIIDGLTHYLDSVSEFYNVLFEEYGLINSEDSTYWLIAPTNSEWNRLVAQYEPYFNYPNNVAKRDSLVYTNTRMAIMGGTFFSRTLNPDVAFADSAVSTMAPSALVRSLLNSDYAYYTYYKPFAEGGVFYGTDDIVCSNGHVRKASHFNVSMYDTFLQTVKVEAESIQAQDTIIDAVDPLIVREVTSDNPFYGKVSGNTFVEVAPDPATAQVTVSYKINGLLSEVPYDIYAVFAPATAYDPMATDEASKPNIVRSILTYKDQNGRDAQRRFNQNKRNDPAVVDTVQLASGVTFPTCSYGLSEAQVKLRIMSVVSSSQTATNSLTLRLDCIIVKPSNTDKK